MHGFVPDKYQITLEPDLESCLFAGRVIIDGHLAEPGNRIHLHAREITVHSARIEHRNEHLAVSATIDEAEMLLTLEAPRQVEGGIRIIIDYRGVINDAMAGLYQSPFRENGTTRMMAVTQFEEIDARRAFPCVDEPAAKARFDVAYILPKNVAGIANTPLKSETDLSVHPEETLTGEAGKRRLDFETTPPMSTYLLFFAMGPFEFETDTQFRIPVRAATRPGLSRYGKNAIEWTREALRYGEEYTGIQFPIGKMDLIACPNFAFGAMENYGAISFRENRMLVYGNDTPSAEVERICQITNHEVAHMWFGNLVTPKDWSYIWLNEAFATYFGYVITDTFHPEFNGLDQFIASQMDIAFSRDGLAGTIPIEFPDGQELEFSPATTPIIYRKAGSILRMFRLYLGDCGLADREDGDARDSGGAPVFREGVRRYLGAFSESSANTDDFLTSFSEGVRAVPEAPDFDHEILAAWIRTPGYPMIRAHTEGSTLYLRRERFTYHETGAERNTSTYTAQCPPVPLTLRLFHNDGTDTQMRHLLDSDSAGVALPESVEAVKLNADQAGFYRTEYGSGDAELLCSIASERMSARDRFNLLYDMHALVVKGSIDLETYLSRLNRFFTEEIDFLPSFQLSRSLRTLHLHAVTVAPDTAARIAEIGLALLRPAMNAMGIMPSDGEPHTNALLRESLLWSAYRFGDREVSETLEQKAEALIHARGPGKDEDADSDPGRKRETGDAGDPEENADTGRAPERTRDAPGAGDTPDALPVNLRPLLYRVAASGLPHTVEALIDRQAASGVPEGECQEIVTALGHAGSREALSTVLESLLARVPARNCFLAIQAAGSNPHARHLLWPWMQAHIQELEGLHRMHFLSALVTGIAKDGAGREDEISRFVASYRTQSSSFSEETVEMALEYREINEALERRLAANDERRLDGRG